MASLAGVLGLVLFVWLVGATSWTLCRTRAGHAIDALVAVAGWCAALTVSCVWVLSLAHALTPWTLLGLAAAVAALVHGRRTRAERPPIAWVPPRGERWLLVGALPLLAFVALAAYAAARAPEVGSDNLAYHLPRLGYWMQQRAVDSFLANNPRIGSFPPNGNVLQLVPVLFLRHDRLCGFVQAAAAVGTAGAIFALARGLRATPFAASLSAVAWFAIPCMLEQAERSFVDVTAAFFVAASAGFASRPRASAFELSTALAAASLAIGTKTQVAVLALPLLIVCAWRLWRDHRLAARRVAVWAPVGAMALGGWFHLRNVLVWSDPGGPASVRWVVVSPSLHSLVKNLALALAPLSLPAQPGQPWHDVLRAAVTSYGLGLTWLLLALGTGALLLFDMLRARDPRARAWLPVAAAGVMGTLVLCYGLRHQDAVVRFLLPVIAVHTATFAWAFDRVGTTRLRRWLVAACVWGAAGLLVWRWDNVTRGWRQVWGGYTYEARRYGPELEAVAGAIDRLPPGTRIGLVGWQYFPERLFFGRRFQHRLVPLSYDPPRTLAQIEALSIDALWLDTSSRCRIELFRRDFVRPRGWADASWRPHVGGFDRDFRRAYTLAVEVVDASSTARALAEPGSDWGLVAREARGALLVKGRGEPVDAARLCGGP
jgi:hypothetical protein